MKTIKKGRAPKEVLMSQGAINESLLAQSSLNLNEAKRKNNDRKKKQLGQRESEWNI